MFELGTIALALSFGINIRLTPITTKRKFTYNKFVNNLLLAVENV